ncbi:hypothetical protein Pmar_PMAR015462 [Perkinsus marinus ATCC 50983]|uniref:Uncharacterized protein n=1 Tax=Perkinsus marinus (strain ATCC 50983 / TXsc) TaxID=423536 RepID=C5L893_PERM5|nr:hypothetical protein Pmar_PMAR015462 [Perkinsus marinus ATCC 50983]EER07049.1 hypothetical protein Pmar_PMAR015462 [Perkinsus marinus ATCC 50983]|eukprot:XP_002775233.1 hypothetical protein Pmar_PMAR015462 [Perkinsus marinus ATCC 50983]
MSSLDGTTRRRGDTPKLRSSAYRPLAVLADPIFLEKRQHREMNRLWRDIVRKARQEKAAQDSSREFGFGAMTSDAVGEDILGNRVVTTGSSMDVLDSLPHLGCPEASPAPSSSEGSIDGRSLQAGDVSDPGVQCSRPRLFTPERRRSLSPVKLQKRPRTASRTPGSRAAERVERRRASLRSPGLSLGLRDYCETPEENWGSAMTGPSESTAQPENIFSATGEPLSSIFMSPPKPTGGGGGGGSGLLDGIDGEKEHHHQPIRRRGGRC